MNYCPACGQKLEESMKFCSNCGQKIIEPGTRPTIEVKPEEINEPRTGTVIIERAEPTYYSDDKGVRITATRLIMPGKTPQEGPTTYSMANITSVKTVKEEPNRLAGVFIAVLGIIAIVVGIYSDYNEVTIGGVVALLIGLAAAILVKPVYHLKIASASGEMDALNRKEKDYIDRIVTAINEALIKRG